MAVIAAVTSGGNVEGLIIIQTILKYFPKNLDFYTSLLPQLVHPGTLEKTKILNKQFYLFMAFLIISSWSPELPCEKNDHCYKDHMEIKYNLSIIRG